MWDEPLNTTIDEVARQMTEGTPGDGAAFRRRVIARIAAQETPRASRRPLFVVVSLAAAIVIAIVVTRPAGPKAPALPPRTEIASGQGPSGPGVPESRVPMNTGTVTAGPKLRVMESARRPGPFEHGIAGTIPEPPPQLDPLDVAPLTVDRLQPAPITVDRLDTIAPILVAPLESIEEQRRYE